MSNWIHATLKDICRPEKGSIISGPFGSNISSKFFVDEGVPVIRGNNLSLSLDKFYDDGFVFVTQEKADELNCYALEGDLLFTGAGTIGQVGILEAPLKYEKYVISNKQLRARIDTSKVDLLYAYYWFSSAWMQDYFIRNNKGSTVPLISLSELKDAPISYPEDISAQKRIVAAIEALSQKIETNRSICTELESTSKTIYDYWFTQFDFPDADGKPYRSSGGAMVWNEQIKRAIPQGWLATTMSALTTVVTGKEDANFSVPHGKYKFFTCAQETILCDTPAFSGHAVLIAGNGDFNVKHYSGQFNAYQRTYVLIPNDEKYYAIMYIVAQQRIQAFKQGSNGSIVKFITKGDVENIPVLIPDDEALLEPLNQILFKIEHCERENDELTKLRDWLLPMLMNGQATVK